MLCTSRAQTEVPHRRTVTLGRQTLKTDPWIATVQKVASPQSLAGIEVPVRVLTGVCPTQCMIQRLLVGPEPPVEQRRVHRVQCGEATFAEQGLQLRKTVELVFSCHTQRVSLPRLIWANLVVKRKREILRVHHPCRCIGAFASKRFAETVALWKSGASLVVHCELGPLAVAVTYSAGQRSPLFSSRII